MLMQDLTLLFARIKKFPQIEKVLTNIALIYLK